MHWPLLPPPLFFDRRLHCFHGCAAFGLHSYCTLSVCVAFIADVPALISILLNSWLLLLISPFLLLHHPPSKKFYVLVDVAFNEQESNFTSPYLQGDNSTMEDKDMGDFLL